MVDRFCRLFGGKRIYQAGHKPTYALLAGENVGGNHNAENKVVNARCKGCCEIHRTAENSLGIA